MGADQSGLDGGLRAKDLGGPMEKRSERRR